MIIWIFQTGEPLHCDGSKVRGMRAMNLADSLVSNGHHVTVWSSAFNHQKKEHRAREYSVLKVSENLDIRLIPSRGYSSNLSLQRLLDHAQLAFNLAKSLSRENQAPDIAFVGYPPIEFAFVAVRWLRPKRIPVLIDVKDQWPQIFVDRLNAPLKPLARLIFSPYFAMSRNTILSANAVSTISPAFMNWVNTFSKRKTSQFDCVATLSPLHPVLTSKELADSQTWWRERGLEANGCIKFIFVGSMSRAFDFNPIYELAAEALRKNLDWQFILCGDGERAQEIKIRFSHLANVVMPGWVDWPKIVLLSKSATFGLAPYHPTKDFNQSIPNKVVDYFSFGLPVVSALSGEVRRLIDSRRVGINYDPANINDFFATIEAISENRNILNDMSNKVVELYEERFKGEAVYKSLCRTLEQLKISHEVVAKTD